MRICENCGVELDEDMPRCPLCGSSVNGTTPDVTGKIPRSKQEAGPNITGTVPPKEKRLLQRILWQVTSILIFSGIISTLIIDLTVHMAITWSIYPVTICMIIFCYASLFAFWHAKIIYQLIVGMLIVSLLLVLIDIFLPHTDWPVRLALPLLFSVNLITITLMGLVNTIKYRGLNVIAYTCVGMAVLCISIESILSLYRGSMALRWSIIVAACLLPVTAALLFMHHRIKNKPETERIFHT